MTVRRQQRGVAALTAMLVVAIATVLAVELIWELNLNLRRTENLLAREQARQIALGLELLAAELLERDAEDAGEIDSLDEEWAQDYGFPFEGGSVVGKLEDLQGRFNLNSLIDLNGKPVDPAQERFRRLLTDVVNDLETRDVNVDNVVDSVIDWMDGDQQPGLGGAEDGLYTGRTPPYRTGNFWFTTPTELLAVNGVTPELFAALRPLVSALPPTGGQSGVAGKVNINTAKQEVLVALSDDVTDAVAEGWIADRESNPYEDIMTDFWQDAGAVDFFPPESDGGQINPESFLDVRSNYFGLTVNVTIGTTRLAMYSLLERSSGGSVSARLRSFDTD
ncbi:MAG: type II secretion system minor pseudopilin GspK [Gammaproteobacteria bacterium]|nr:type II secretion system minor pseudopilin GspK [Gammaproteobacteria bacterium]